MGQSLRGVAQLLPSASPKRIELVAIRCTPGSSENLGVGHIAHTKAPWGTVLSIAGRRFGGGEHSGVQPIVCFLPSFNGLRCAFQMMAGDSEVAGLVVHFKVPNATTTFGLLGFHEHFHAV